MDVSNLDRSQLKNIIREILKEDISLFKEVIKEILIDNHIITTDEQQQRRARLEKLIDEDFDKYDDVFKSLA